MEWRTGGQKSTEPILSRRSPEFLIRIQASNDFRPDLDGAWIRALDYKRRDYWGSNADHGWGAWSVENGWTQGWVTTVLALRELNLNLWEPTKNLNIKVVFDRTREIMMPDSQIALP
jgi:hypothetical protein